MTNTEKIFWQIVLEKTNHIHREECSGCSKILCISCMMKTIKEELAKEEKPKVQIFYQAQISPEMVYGNQWQPYIKHLLNNKNYKLVSFAPPKAGQIYVADTINIYKSDSDWPERSPRLILEEKTESKDYTKEWLG